MMMKLDKYQSIVQSYGKLDYFSFIFL